MSAEHRKNLRRLFDNPSPWPEPDPETDEEDQPPPPLTEELEARLLGDMERAFPSRPPTGG